MIQKIQLSTQAPWLLTQGKVDNHKVQWMIDTGASSTVLSKKQAQSIGYSMDGKEVVKGAAGSGMDLFTPITLKEITVGETKVKNVPALVQNTVEDSGNPFIMLGLDVLKKLKAKIDCAKAKMEITSERLLDFTA